MKKKTISLEASKYCHLFNIISLLTALYVKLKEESN